MTRSTAQYILAVFAVLAIGVVWFQWKKEDKKRAFNELELTYGAQVSISENGFYIGCSNPRLTDLVDFAKVAARIGKPTILDLTGAPNLTTLKGIEQLPSLVSLNAVACPSLVSTEGLAGHPSLLEVVLIDSVSLVDVSSIDKMPALQTLDLSGCVGVTSVVPQSLPSLKNLYLSRCANLESLDVAGMPGLQYLFLDNCPKLPEIKNPEVLTQLSDLDLSLSSSIQVPDSIYQLANLIVLDLRGVTIPDLSTIAQASKLTVLRLAKQANLTDLTPFSSLSELKELHVEEAPNLASLEGIPPFLSNYVGFTNCPKLTSLAGIEKAPRIEQLNLSGSKHLADVSALSSLSELVQLNLVQCTEVTDVSAIAKLRKLTLVMLGGSGVTEDAVEPMRLEMKRAREATMQEQERPELGREQPEIPDVMFDFTVSS